MPLSVDYKLRRVSEIDTLDATVFKAKSISKVLSPI